MTSDAIAVGPRGKNRQRQAIGLVLAGHFVCHFHTLVMPPATMLVLAATVGMKAALIVAGLIGFVVAVPLLLAPGVEGEAGPSQPVARARPQAQQNGRVFSPAILGLTVFFILLSLSTSG